MRKINDKCISYHYFCYIYNMEKIKVTALEKMTMDYIVCMMYDEKGFSDKGIIQNNVN